MAGRLGDKLVKLGLITPEHLQIALKEQKRTGEVLGETLLRLGFITQEQLTEVLSEYRGIERIDLSSYIVDPLAVSLVPKDTAAKYRVIPISLEGDTLTVGMVNPFDLEAIDVLLRITRKRIKKVSIKESEFEEAFRKYYGEIKTIDEIVEELLSERIPPGEIDRRIVQLVDYILLKGVREKATDVHIEPAEEVVRIRYRVDGVLHEIMSPPVKIRNALTSRIKIMSNINIAEKRIPQDGRFKMKIKGREVDFRVSTLPTMFGEKIVTRPSFGLIKRAS